jgi:hypothetical protein
MPYGRPPLTKELMGDEISEDELPLVDEEWLTRDGCDDVYERGRELIAQGAAWS